MRRKYDAVVSEDEKMLTLWDYVVAFVVAITTTFFIVGAAIAIVLAWAAILFWLTGPALAQKTRWILPPAEFDRPFDGRLFTTRAKTPEELREACRWRAFPSVGALGCATYISASICSIYMASDEVIEAAGYTPEIVLRHEIAHCNGWPKDHAGARLWGR